MKTVRVLLLVLLAMLLPLRGALAEAVHCADAAGSDRVEWRLHDHAAPHAQASGSDHEAHEHHMPGQHDHASGVPDECNLCSASCSTSPLMSALPALVTPTGCATLVYPGLDTPAPSFLSDGQERPPRSL